MTISHGYTDATTFKSYLGITVTSYDTLIDSVINAASRTIDNYCQRRFWLDANPVARTFTPTAGLTYLEFGDDLGSTSGLVVASDPGGDGTYDTTWDLTDYQLLPVNAATAYAEPRPWTAMRGVGTRTFPWLVNTWLTRLDRVQITGRWGWPAIPDAVAYACLIKSARLFHRKDSPQGIAGFGDFGPVRLSRHEDGDVMSLLDGYQKYPVLVG